MSAPLTWVNVTAGLRTSEVINSFGPRLLMLTDTPETGSDLLSGNLLNEGAFVFGYVGDPVTSEKTPGELLSELLEVGEQEGTEVHELSTGTNGKIIGAFTDLSTNPLEGLPFVQQPFLYRLSVLLNPDSGERATFLMGADPGNWDSYIDLYSDLLNTVSLPDGSMNVYGQLVSGDLIQGKLEQDKADVWTFNGEGGHYATITLTPEDNRIDLTLKLLDPNGNILINMDKGYADDFEVLTDVLLPDNGTYFIEAAEFFDEEGAYQLSLLMSEEPQFGGGGRLEFDKEITAELAEDGEHLWVLDGTAGQEISVILSSLNDQLDVILELRGPDGRELVILDEGFVGDAEILTGFELSVTGEYVILVQGFAGHGGTYSLYLSQGGESTINFYDAGNLAYGNNERELLRQDEAHAWFFNGRTGDEVTIEVSPIESNLDLDIWLLDPELNEIIKKDEYYSGESEEIEQILPMNGQYLILVREFFGEPGEYEIALTAGGGDALEIAGPLNYDQTVSGVLTPGKQTGWIFDGREGDIINVFVEPTESERDLVIVLVDPGGDTAITVDDTQSDSPEQLASFELSSGGEWMIIVQEFFNEGSSYELRISMEEP